MQMHRQPLTCNNRGITWNCKTNARLFQENCFSQLRFFLGFFFLLFRSITHCISPHHKTVSYISLLWFKWFMTHSLIVVCYTIIVISIIWYMSHFLCSYLLQSMIVMSLNIGLSSFCIDDDHILCVLDTTSFHIKLFTALLFTIYWALQASPVDYKSSLKFILCCPVLSIFLGHFVTAIRNCLISWHHV